jgi:hypothetical protein
MTDPPAHPNGAASQKLPHIRCEPETGRKSAKKGLAQSAKRFYLRVSTHP